MTDRSLSKSCVNLTCCYAVVEDVQEDEEAAGPSSGAEEAADMMQEDEEAHAGPSSGGGEAAGITETDEEAAAGPSSGGAQAADLRQEDEELAARPDSNDNGDKAVAGPSSTDGAESNIKIGSLSTNHTAMMKTMLQRMFKHNAGARPGLAQLVEQFNKSAMKPASAECIHQASSENQVVIKHGLLLQ